MKTDPLQAAADATAGYLLELARKGTTVITRDELEAFFRSEGIAESPNAVAFVLVGRELLRAHDRPVQQLPRTRGTWGGNATAAFFHVGWVDNEPDTWTILPAVLVTPEPKAGGKRGRRTVEAKGGDRATVYKVIRDLADEGVSRAEIRELAKEPIANFLIANSTAKTGKKRRPDDVIRAALARHKAQNSPD